MFASVAVGLRVFKMPFQKQPNTWPGLRVGFQLAWPLDFLEAGQLLFQPRALVGVQPEESTSVQFTAFRSPSL